VGDERLAEVVRLASHDLRTPLATISGFAKTMVRGGALPEREARFAGMIDEAAEQLAGLVAQLSLAGALVSGRHHSAVGEVDTLELARGTDARVSVDGEGETIETDPALVAGALAALAAAALRHGLVDSVAWQVDGRELTLAPVASSAAVVLDGSSPKDLGALVARLALDSVGATVVVERDALRVRL
jgi:signal transduction histidine kinase